MKTFKECYERMEKINPAILDLTSDEFDRFVKQYNTEAVFFPEKFEDIIESQFDGSRVKFTPVKNPFYEQLQEIGSDDIVSSLVQMKEEFEAKVSEVSSLSTELINQMQERISSLEVSIDNLKSSKHEIKEKAKTDKKDKPIVEEKMQEAVIEKEMELKPEDKTNDAK